MKNEDKELMSSKKFTDLIQVQMKQNNIITHFIILIVTGNNYFCLKIPTNTVQFCRLLVYFKTVYKKRLTITCNGLLFEMFS